MRISSAPPFSVSSLELPVHAFQAWGVSSSGTEPLLDSGARRLWRLRMVTWRRV